jgi:hypothetical protein
LPWAQEFRHLIDPHVGELLEVAGLPNQAWLSRIAAAENDGSVEICATKTRILLIIEYGESADSRPADSDNSNSRTEHGESSSGHSHIVRACVHG